MKRLLEWILVLIGTATSLFVVVSLWQDAFVPITMGRRFFLPLIFAQIIGFCVTSLLAVALDKARNLRVALWVTSGVLLAVTAVGIWSFGVIGWLIVSAAAFGYAQVLINKRRENDPWKKSPVLFSAFAGTFVVLLAIKLIEGA